MTVEHTRRALVGLVAGSLAGCLEVGDGNGDPSAAADPDGFEIETVAEGLTNPWGLAFVPDSPRLLVTERPGRLVVVDREAGEYEPVEGTPAVDPAGQGGLLDVTVWPDGSETWVYLTYSAANEDGDTATHLGRGRLDPDAPRLDGFERLHVAEPFVDSSGHYGSRVVVGPDDAVYVTTGDRQFKNFGPEHVSQDTSNELGATLRLAPDGSVPADNPFVDDPDVRDAIFSYGHRNAQGMTIHPETGAIWQSEHGEEDGDELNIVEAGGNYGWPVATYGCRYGTDDPVGDRPDEREDTVEPVHHWPCGSGGFPPAGMTFYDGESIEAWHGDLFVGNLAGQYLGRFEVDGTEVTEREPLLADRGWRIRDVEAAPDTGRLHVAVDSGDAPIVRLVPE